MQNVALLREAAATGLPILLKRHFGATIDEFIGASEYIREAGNEQVILCERGIRSFEQATRFTLDVAAIPILQQRTGLPVLVDPSHAAGQANLVRPLALAAVAAGADGLMIEVHQDPTRALSDGVQSLTVDAFGLLAEEALALADHQAIRNSGAATRRIAIAPAHPARPLQIAGDAR
jgi:3-deoxy-7-phosphoheptulonate synthase